MYAQRFIGNTRNTAERKLFKEKLVHFRFKVRTGCTRIVVINVTLNARSLRSWDKLKTMTQTIENKGTISVITKFFFPSVEIQRAILERSKVSWQYLKQGGSIVGDRACKSSLFSAARRSGASARFAFVWL